MRKIILILICLFCFGLNIKADKVLTDEQWNNLPEETRSTITLENNAEKTSKWTNIGKEIGIAVNETLTAIESSAQRISETHLGRIAIGIVVWKLLYKDILQIVIGITLLILAIIYWNRAYKIISAKDFNSYDDVIGGANIIACVVLLIAALICLFC